MDWLTKEKRQQTTWHQMAEQTNKSLSCFLYHDNTLLYEKHFRETIVNIKKLSYKYQVIKRTFNFWKNRYY